MDNYIVPKELDFLRNTRSNSIDEDVIVLVTVGGEISGLSRETGELLWRRNNGNAKIRSKYDESYYDEHENLFRNQEKEKKDILFSPLVSTTTTEHSETWRMCKFCFTFILFCFVLFYNKILKNIFIAAVPSIDGRVHHSKHESSLPDLVARTPYVDKTGRFYVGSRQSSIAAFDKHTGETLTIITSVDESKEALQNLQAFADMEDHDHILYIGRVDYGVSVYDVASREIEVSFSNSVILSVSQMIQQGFAPDETSHIHESTSSDTSYLLSTPDGNVALYNPIMERIEWVATTKFPSPVAYGIHSHSGNSMLVHILPDLQSSTPNTQISLENIREHMQNQIKSFNPNDFIGSSGSGSGSSDLSNSIIQNLDNGDIFALPYGPVKPLWSNTKTKNAMIKNQNIPTHLLDSIKHSDESFKLESKQNQPHDFENVYYIDPNDFDKRPYIVLPPKTRDEKWYHTFIKVLTSWIPPAVALAFVISFELGRRERLKKETNNIESKDITMTKKRNNPPKILKQNLGVIQVSDDILGYGGHGTIVYRGTLASRSVAVKRMLQTYHASADREISLLISSDGHPNVVRYFLKEARGDFVYLALELCDLSLHDMIAEMKAIKHQKQEKERAMKLMLKQIAEGVKHLHGLRIVHRDLKPQNILLKRKHTNVQSNRLEAFLHGEFVPKISDMGLGKQLAGQSSFGLSTLGNGSIMKNVNSIGSIHSTSEKILAGPGSVGWQAPEVMSLRLSAMANLESESSLEASPLLSMAAHRTSRSVDIFSLGCVFHSTLLDGLHPFGEWYEREANIMKNIPDIDGLDDISLEAKDLIGCMLHREPRRRPSALHVCEHIYFWDTGKRLAFISELSDRVEAEMLSTPEHPIAWHLERNAASVVGLAWDQMLDRDLISNTSKFRTYDPSSVRDCLRLIRNKCHHYDELSTEVKARIGATTDGLMNYIDQKFPKLLIHCFDVCRNCLDQDDVFAKKFHIPVKTVKTVKTVNTNPPISQKEHSNDNHLDHSLNHNESVVENCIPDTPIQHHQKPMIPHSVIIWEKSESAKSFQCRGWMRSTSFWIHEPSSLITKRNPNITRCADDPKFRTRLCNHWDVSLGTRCPMRKKNKCVFAHGPIELRVKEGKRKR